MRGIVEKAVSDCRALGAEVEEISLPHTDLAIPVYYIIATAEASSNLARYDGVRYTRRSPSAADVVDMYFKSRAEGFGRGGQAQDNPRQLRPELGVLRRLLPARAESPHPHTPRL